MFGAFGAPKPAAPAFGQAQPSSSTTASPFGAFGQPASTSTTAPAGQSNPTGSLFGGPNAFGTNNNATQAANEAPKPSLFGAFGGAAGASTTTPSAPSATTAQSSNPFGAFGASTTTPASGSTTTQSNPFGAFGGNALSAASGSAPSNAGTGTGLFGAFGASTTITPKPAGTGLFASTLGGQPSTNPLAQPPQSTANFSLERTTNFNDLPQEYKQEFEKIEAQIQENNRIRDELKARKLGKEARQASKMLHDILPTAQSVTTQVALDAESAKDLKLKLDQATRDEMTALEIVQAFKEGNHVKSQAHAAFPLEYYTRVVHQLIERLLTYQHTVEAIERQLSSLTDPHPQSPQAISSTLRAQHATFMSLAAAVSNIESRMKLVREAALKAWRARTGNSWDPFTEGGGAFGASTLGKNTLGGSVLGSSILGGSTLGASSWGRR